MSALVDCPNCQRGNHAGHRHDWNVRKGLLGGAVCGCKGDCKERAAKRTSRFAGLLAEIPLVEMCPKCDNQGHYDGRVLVNGRGVYTCYQCGNQWQDANEKPDTKAVPITMPATPEDTPRGEGG